MTRSVPCRVYPAFSCVLVIAALRFTTGPAAAQCVGDCDLDGRVRIPEAQRCVNIRTGAQTLQACPAADQNLDGVVDDNEIDACIRSFLDASTCPQVFTPVPTNTPLATPTLPPSPTNTQTPTRTPTRTPTNTVAPTGTPTNTPAPTNTMPPPTPAKRTCAFNEATGDSNLDIILTGNTSIGALVGLVSGAVELACGTQDANGKRDCTCSLQAWTPVNITGIGFVCIDGAGSCPSGEMDCDGGNALGVDSLDDHQIGSCTSHADCSSKCDTYCAGQGMVQLRSGCENFCQGGTRDGLACICDQVGSSGCVGGTPGVNDCPGGSCVGKNNETDQDCQCYCAYLGFGGPSAPGTFQCQIPTDIKVVAALPCSNAALVDLPPICAPATSGSARGRTVNANEDSMQSIGPQTLLGSSDTCANFDSGTTSGYKAVTNIAFFDSTVGDLRAHLTIDCQ